MLGLSIDIAEDESTAKSGPAKTGPAGPLAMGL